MPPAKSKPPPARFKEAGSAYGRLIREHYDRFLAVGLDTYGPAKTPMWLASVDVLKGGLPAAADPARKRAYRLIHAPRGSTLYWDLPAVVCARHVSRITGDDRYRRAAEAYVREVLGRCVSKANGLLLWGNHIYYDVVKDQPVYFAGGHHEVRPLRPAWEVLWSASPEATERCIRSIGLLHVHDPAGGEFDRHASPTAAAVPSAKRSKAALPFLEAGGSSSSRCAGCRRRPGGATRR